MAMQDGVAKYATAVSKSDTIDWRRDQRADGDIVIDVEKNEIVCEGLSMPQSPRLYSGKLWVLNSETGELGWVDLSKKDLTKRFQSICFCPGFTRGDAFYGKYTLVGHSKPRYECFEYLALDKRFQEADTEPRCGVRVIDLGTGACVQWFRIDGKFGELYDVEIIPNSICPRSHGFLKNDVLGVITMEDHGLDQS